MISNVSKALNHKTEWFDVKLITLFFLFLSLLILLLWFFFLSKPPMTFFFLYNFFCCLFVKSIGELFFPVWCFLFYLLLKTPKNERNIILLHNHFSNRFKCVFEWNTHSAFFRINLSNIFLNFGTNNSFDINNKFFRWSIVCVCWGIWKQSQHSDINDTLWCFKWSFLSFSNTQFILLLRIISFLFDYHYLRKEIIESVSKNMCWMIIIIFLHTPYGITKMI